MSVRIPRVWWPVLVVALARSTRGASCRAAGMSVEPGAAAAAAAGWARSAPGAPHVVRYLPRHCCGAPISRATWTWVHCFTRIWRPDRGIAERQHKAVTAYRRNAAAVPTARIAHGSRNHRVRLLTREGSAHKPLPCMQRRRLLNGPVARLKFVDQRLHILQRDARLILRREDE